MGLDSQGNSIKRTLKKKELINLQSKTAEILGMQRGRNYVAEKAKRPKRLDTYEFKKAKEMEAAAKESKLLKTTFDQLLATKKDLAAAQSEAREYLKELGATREDYAKLEQLNKDLKEQVKENALTIEDLNSNFNSLKYSLEEKFNSLIKEKEHFKSVVELKEVEILDLEPYKDLYFSQEHDLNALQEQNKVLVEKVSSLQEKINSSPNMEQYEHFKKQHEVRGKIIFEEAKQIQDLEPEKTNLRMLVDYFKNTINDLKTKVSNLFKRNQELESENKALKDELYELKRDRIIESGKENPHEAIRKTLENAGLTGYSKLQEMQKKDLNEIIENNRRKAEKEKLEQEQQRQKQRDSLTR
jgi:peptidoglycan hydrolase CwlO-like protein